MYRKFFSLIALTFAALPMQSRADAVAELQAHYRSQGAAQFSASAGRTMWNKVFVDARSGRERSCSACHTSNLRQPGKHARTGKPIQPMAPSVNAERLTDTAKIEKWFLRNCKWTVGRKCTAQEKANLLSFIKSQ